MPENLDLTGAGRNLCTGVVVIILVVAVAKFLFRK